MSTSAQTLSNANPEELSGLHIFLATLAVCVGTLLISLDQFIANVAIPTIAGDLGVSQDNGTWVITSYTVASAITIPLTGWLTSSIGRIRLFSLSAILFAFFSLLCGLAPSFNALLSFRVLQGLVSGSLIPLSQALLLMLHPKRKGMAMGVWGLVVMVGPAMGPVLGGWITETISWRWIFNINVPLGIISGMAVLALLPRFESKRVRLPIDTIGLVLLVVTVGSLQVMLDRGTDDDWFRSSFIVTLAIIAVIGFCFFIVWELFHAHPIVDLSFFKDRDFSLSALLLGLAVFVLFGNLIVGPIWVQQPLGYTPLWAGLSITPLGISAMFLFPLVGIFLDKLDARIWVALGFLTMGSTFLYLSMITINTPFSNLAYPRLIQGVGFAFFYVPLTALAFSRISEEKMASAAGLFSFTRMIAISNGVSLATAYYTLRENFFQSRYGEFIIPSNPQFALYYQKLKEGLGLTGLHADAFVYKMVQGQAYTETFFELCFLGGWAYLLMIGAVFFFHKPQKKGAGVKN